MRGGSRRYYATLKFFLFTMAGSALMLVGIVVLVGALTYFPAVTLGPVVEHLLMQQGRAF